MGNKYARTDTGSRWTAKGKGVSDALRHHEAGFRKENWGRVGDGGMAHHQ